MKGIIFDTNIFQKIVEREIDFDEIVKIIQENNFQSFSTHIQWDEINNCSHLELKNKMKKIFSKINPTQLASEGLVVGVSRVGKAKVTNGKLFDKIKGNSKKHTKDALIGTTSIKNNLLLISNDKRLRNRINENEGEAISLSEFKELKNE